MTPEYLNTVQRAGWNIRFVGLDHVRVGCPQVGCNLVVKLNEGQPVPKACVPQANGYLISGYENLRQTWQRRQRELGLTNPDVEHIVGCADSHYSKIIRDNWASKDVATNRMPNAEFALNISEALGFDVLLIPRPLSPKALRTISETRHLLERRMAQPGFRMIRSSE